MGEPSIAAKLMRCVRLMRSVADDIERPFPALARDIHETIDGIRMAESLAAIHSLDAECPRCTSVQRERDLLAAGSRALGERATIAESECAALRARAERAERERDALLGKKAGRDPLFDAEAWDGAMNALGLMRERAERAEEALRRCEALAEQFEARAAYDLGSARLNARDGHHAQALVCDREGHTYAGAAVELRNAITPRTNAAPSRGGDAASRPDRPATSLLKTEPAAPSVAEKEGR